jgi:alanine racemase
MSFVPQGRPTWAEVDLSALQWNFRQVRRLIGPAVKCMAVVKANAYGHGAVACSRALVRAGADVLGVATVEEGAELRAAGIKVPVVVLGITQPGEAQAILDQRLQITVTSWAQIGALLKLARVRNIRVSLHVKVDTGMGRIGVSAELAGELIHKIQKCPEARLTGVFTHFAHAGGDTQWVKLQMSRLRSVTQQLDSGVLVHAANSAAVIQSPETHAHMVRPGLMLYGLYPGPQLKNRVQLKPILSWKTKIVELKKSAPGTGLSYGHTFVTRRTSRIATLPVGYADGFSRALSNRGRVLIRGQQCPVVGRVCMDMCLVDVTRVQRARVGDEAVLIGKQGQAELPAEDMAKQLHTITYEVACTIGARVPRFQAGGMA